MEHREVELGILGALLKRPDNIGTVSEILKPDDFDWLPYKQMYQAMLELSKNSLGIDSITLGDYLHKQRELDDFCIHYNPDIVGRNAIVKVREDGRGENAVSYAKIAKNYSQNRQILQILSDGASWVKNDRNTAEILKDLSVKLSDIQPVESKTTISFNEAVSKAMTLTEEAGKGNVEFLKTGLTFLDNLMLGLSAPDLTIVAARPGVGKTAFLATCVFNIMRHYANKTIVFFTLEMGSEQVAMRFISMASGIPYSSQRTGKLTDVELSKYYQSIGDLTKNNYSFHLNDMPAIKPRKIRQELRKFKKIDLIVLDYIQLADPDEKKENRHLEVGAVSRALKSIAKEFHAPVLAAAQLSRAANARSEDNKKPVMSDLAESGSLERDADNIIFLHRDFNVTMTNVILAKQRNGPVGDFFIDYDPTKTIFTDK
jgi:replicative DNA helicase